MFAVVFKLVLIVFVYCCCRTTASNVSDQYYPYFHLAPPYGWMNDPNGFCVFNNEYHLFYQHNPLTSQAPGIAHWGHAKSTNLFHWTHLDIALYPDKDYDIDGVFSGSAIIEDETMYLIYTGNVRTPSPMQYQALANSTDGINFTKYPGNPVILGEQYQPNVRDPKIWKHDNTYYIVLGNSFVDDNNETFGRVLLYSSKDLISWTQLSILDESDGSLGYMWECPDFFEINGKFVLLFSPQGIQPQGDRFRNLYQTGYIVGDFDYESNIFTPITQFRELDSGHDFYATQSLLDQTERRIVVAWFDMWEQVYPERDDGWTGQITIPRVITLTQDLRLIQKPVNEIEDVRGEVLYSSSGNVPGGTSVKLTNNAAEIRIESCKNKNFQLILEAGSSTVTISYDNVRGTVTMNRGGDDGVRRTKWRPKGQLQMWLYIDRSSIEVFCGEGEVTFSSRFFPNGEVSVRLGDNSEAHEMTVYSMKRTAPTP